MNSFINRKFSNGWSLLLLAATLAMLSGCGPGTAKTNVGTTGTTAGTTAGTTIKTTAAPSLTLALTNTAGTPVTSISTAAPATVTATLTDAAGAAVANAVVTFATNATLATMNPSAGTALTNAAGIASITLNPANFSASGAATIAATAQVASAAVSGSLGYSIGSSTVAVSTPVFGVGVAPLSALGTTSVSVTVSSGGAPVTTPQTVTFSSACAASGKAFLGSATTVNGVATGSYRDNGCAGTDTVTASVTGLASSSAVLTVSPPSAGSIQFISANPINISLKGSGGVPTSQVTFKVNDLSGSPISGKTVTFGLSTTAGGLSLASYSSISDANGQVVAIVDSGTVSTPVRVTASTCPSATTPCSGTTLSTQSSQLSITTGIPDQAGISLSTPQRNIEGLIWDGMTTVMIARLADHFKNPVPDGTTVNFTAEAGSIVGTCNTVAGSCSVPLTSQGVRPNNGRVTVLAYALGEESFIDLNGNGVADLAATVNGVCCTNEMIDINGVSTDMGEAYVDYNENGVRDANEPFIDFNQNGVYDGPDGKYSGVLCDNSTSPPVGSSAGTCAASKTIHVRQSQVIVFSSSTANIVINGGNPVTTLPCVGGAGTTGATFPITVLDVNGNAMPVGTTVSVAITSGATVAFTAIGSGSYVVLDSSSCRAGYAGCPASFASTTFGDTQVTVGTSCPNSNADKTLTVKVTSPKGVETTKTAIVK